MLERAAGEERVVEHRVQVDLPFSVFYMRAPVGADYFWASLCILGAVLFIFRSSWLGVPG